MKVIVITCFLLLFLLDNTLCKPVSDEETCVFYKECEDVGDCCSILKCDIPEQQQGQLNDGSNNVKRCILNPFSSVQMEKEWGKTIVFRIAYCISDTNYYQQSAIDSATNTSQPPLPITYIPFFPFYEFFLILCSNFYSFHWIQPFLLTHTYGMSNLTLSFKFYLQTIMIIII